jgi:hypothetical protein
MSERLNITIHFAITGSDCTHATFYNVAMSDRQNLEGWAEVVGNQLGLKVYTVSARPSVPTRRGQAEKTVNP